MSNKKNLHAFPFSTAKIPTIAGYGIAFFAFFTGSLQANAQTTVKFLNDWRWEGPAAPLLLANKGAFQREKLDVVLTPGTGSGATVAKVASGEFDMGLGDFSALVEHAAKNPTLAPPVAVYILYERTPSTVFIRKSSGALKPKELAGKKIGAPPFDGGRKLWPALASLSQIGDVTWENLDAAKREEAFALGKVDAITGFYFTTLLNIEKQGMSWRDYTMHPFHEYGVNVYGNAIIVNSKFLAEQPKTVEKFLRAYHASLKFSMKDAREAVKSVKEADPTADEQLEWRRARLAFDTFVNTPTVQTNGLGAIDMKRVQSNIDLITSALKLKSKPTPGSIARTDLVPVP